jgi:hypothetical protein
MHYLVMRNDNRPAPLAAMLSLYRARNEAHAASLAAPVTPAKPALRSVPRTYQDFSDVEDVTAVIPRMTRLELVASERRMAVAS